MKSLVVLAVVSLLILSLTLVACGGGSTPAPNAVAYVAHYQSHSLTVVNIPADKTVSRIEIGDSSVSSLTQVPSYPQRVAITPDGSRAYVTDASTSVWAVDTRTNSVTAKIPAGTLPEALVLSPDGKTVYVNTITCGNVLCTAPSQASVEVIDTATTSPKALITFGKTPDTLLTGIAISPDGNRVYVTEAAGGHVWVIDTATNTITATITLPSSGFSDMSISPDGKTLYVLGFTNEKTFDSSYIEVLDTQTNTATTSITLPINNTSGYLALSPDGSHAYVTDGNNLLVIDITKNALVASVQLSEFDTLQGVAVTPDGTRAYVTCQNSTIYVLDTATNRVVDTVRSDYPGGLAITRAR